MNTYKKYNKLANQKKLVKSFISIHRAIEFLVVSDMDAMEDINTLFDCMFNIFDELDSKNKKRISRFIKKHSKYMNQYSQELEQTLAR